MRSPETLLIIPKLSGGQECVRPLLHVPDTDVEPRRDDTALVQSSRQIDHYLATAMVIDDFKLADVTVLHHNRKEPDDDL